MSLFKRNKEIDSITFWKNKVDYLFSEAYENKFQSFLATKYDVLVNASIIDLKNHLIASNIELINIAFAKNKVSREKRIEIAFLRDDYIKSKNGQAIIGLISDYIKQFGSSFDDGIRPMAHYFSMSIETKNKKELEEFIYDLFYLVLNELFDEIQNIKLV